MTKSNCIHLETEIRPRRCVRHGQTDTTSEMRVQFTRVAVATHRMKCINYYVQKGFLKRAMFFLGKD